MLKPYFYILYLVLFFCSTPFTSYAEEIVTDKQGRWSFLSGYGSSYPGWGKTEERVETIDFLLRYQIPLQSDWGSSWYRGSHSLLLELPFHWVFNPDEGPMLGLNFLACYTFTSTDKYQPYLFAGGGPLYSNLKIPGMGDEWNGNYQFGAGVQHKMENGKRIFLEYRFHHVSNGSTESPNVPLNSNKFLVGINF